MALLANLLAVAFAGLFFQNTIDVPFSATFRQPYDLKFVSMNGDAGPQNSALGSAELSGAYRGGDGHDQFFIAESNYTRNTSLPAWTDDKMFYLPMFTEELEDKQPNGTQFEATTAAFGATLDCERLKLGHGIEAHLDNEQAYITANLSTNTGTVACNNAEKFVVRKCLEVHSALELTVQLRAQGNLTRQKAEVCESTILLAWIRGPQGLCWLGKDTPLRNENTLFLSCRPRLMAGTAKVRVSANGRLQAPADLVSLDSNVTSKPSTLFSNDPIELMKQSNDYIFRNPGNSGVWHNKSFSSTIIDHFMLLETNSTRFINPNETVPTMEEIMGPLRKVHSKLFAIWLGRNKKHLLIPAVNKDAAPLIGYRLQPEKRIFVSTTMFIISEAILCTYIIVAIWVYVRRPGEYLARMPTSIAAIITLFAASAAVQDMEGTSQLDKNERSQHLERIGARYGYGSFVGADGRVHIGIEKAPFVKCKARRTWLERRLSLFRKGSM